MESPMARPAINRRTFVKGMGTTFVAGSVPIVLAPGHAAAGPPAGMLRPGTTYSLDGGWLFGGAVSDSPGSQWLPVSLPHCVTPLPWNNWDPASWQHQWRYRRELVLPTMHDDVRLFLDLDGVMTSATATVNGHALAPHQGGYLPFSEELTGLVQQGTNVIDLVVDATWQQVPPDGAAGGAAAVDYLEPGGITRGAALRVEPATAFIADLYAHPRDVLAAEPSLEVSVSVDGGRSGVDGQLDVSLVPAAGGRPLATSRVGLLAAAGTQSVTTATLGGLRGIRLWSPEQPVLYRVDARLSSGSRAIDQASVRTGFRQATFELDGFYLNGQRYLLFGLNRHQLYPYGGMSLPSRVQRKDAELLRQVLNCNLVRCSHYPQSPAFLDACDELGLMVWEEVPGWGYIGEAAWKELWFQDVTSTVVRDRSRPSVVIWGAQPNETSPGFADASSAKQLAKASDPDRPTGGTQTSWDNPSYVQDVYAYDDYGSTQNPDGTVDVHLRPPTADKPYLVAESVGALLPPHFYERRNAQPSQQRQAILHGQAHSLAQDPAQHYAGLVAWAGFDYSSLSGYQDQHIKTPGVADGFRNLKPGAAMYQAQVDPAERVVIQPSFSWDFGGPSPVTTLGPEALIWSNCDELRVSVGGGAASTLQPQAASFPHLAHPPFALDVSGIDAASEPDLAIEGVVNGRVLASRRFSGSHEGDHLLVQADDDVIAGDGADGTRIAIQSVDRYGAARPFVTGDAMVRIEGPGTLIGLVASLDASVIPAVVSPGRDAHRHADEPRDPPGRDRWLGSGVAALAAGRVGADQGHGQPSLAGPGRDARAGPAAVPVLELERPFVRAFAPVDRRLADRHPAAGRERHAHLTGRVGFGRARGNGDRDLDDHGGERCPRARRRHDRDRRDDDGAGAAGEHGDERAGPDRGADRGGLRQHRHQRRQRSSDHRQLRRRRQQLLRASADCRRPRAGGDRAARGRAVHLAFGARRHAR
jgi:beta-galactosidase